MPRCMRLWRGVCWLRGLCGLRRLCGVCGVRELRHLVQHSLAAELCAHLLRQPLHQDLTQLQRAYYYAQVARRHHTGDV